MGGGPASPTALGHACHPPPWIRVTGAGPCPRAVSSAGPTTTARLSRPHSQMTGREDAKGHFCAADPGTTRGPPHGPGHTHTHTRVPIGAVMAFSLPTPFPRRISFPRGHSLHCDAAGCHASSTRNRGPSAVYVTREASGPAAGDDGSRSGGVKRGMWIFHGVGGVGTPKPHAVGGSAEFPMMLATATTRFYWHYLAARCPPSPTYRQRPHHAVGCPDIWI